MSCDRFATEIAENDRKPATRTLAPLSRNPAPRAEFRPIRPQPPCPPEAEVVGANPAGRAPGRSSYTCPFRPRRSVYGEQAAHERFGQDAQRTRRPTGAAVRRATTVSAPVRGARGGHPPPAVRDHA